MRKNIEKEEILFDEFYRFFWVNHFFRGIDVTTL